jgi:2-methylcitrate dehydratase
MDALTRRVADFAAGLSFERLPEEVVHAATRYVLDSLACAIAAYDCEAANIGRRLARGAAPERSPGRVLGSGERSAAEAAAFVNTAMIRDLDWNDTYPQGHPSDCLGALLAVAETAGADGRRLLTATVAAYELYIRLNDATNMALRGWDQGYIIGVCTAAGVGHLLRLPADRLAQAIAIIGVANVALRNTRAGALGLWKGAATAFATRNAVFATLLAAEGMTGPDRPFQGKHGLMDLITGPFELPPLPGAEAGAFRTPEVQLKYWPLEYQGQLVVWAALELRRQVDWRDLAEISVGTYQFAYREVGSEPEKWDPRTRETADHSLPYIFARALTDGTIGTASFQENAYLDPALRPLMNRIRVHVDDQVEAAYPDVVSMTVEAATFHGRRLSLAPRDPLGHTRNPMRDEDVSAKFLGAAEPVLGQARAAAALERWWDLRNLADLGQALDLLDVGGRAAAR